MQRSSSLPVPELGQIVTVRQRRYVVSDVVPSALPTDVLYNTQTEPQHLISLSSIEDDAGGPGRSSETLQVVWEIEADARINERVGLPEATGFDQPERFDAFLNAVRWGAISSADIRSLQAPFRSGVTIEDYQLDPLVRAVQMPRVNLLIADDVGLGKTIESGLIVQELILRNRARMVLIVCPSSLQIQWRDQMRDKFGLEFRIVDSQMMHDLRRARGLHVNPWSHFPRLVTSIDFLKRDRPMRLMRELLPGDEEPKYPRKFDILIVDEAHNVAPVGRGKYATDSLRTLAIRTLTPHFEHRLFLTATPHNGYRESFSALLELLDNQRFARGVEPDRQQLGAVMVRRLKSELPSDFDGAPRFPKRLVEPIEVDYSQEERQVHAWLREYTESRQSHPQDEQERYATEFIMKLLKKRLFSSPAAFLTTLEQHGKTLEKVKGSAPQRKPTVGILRAQLEQAENDDFEESGEESSSEETLLTATRLFRPLSPRERELLKQMHTWAERASAQPDSKTRELFRWLKGIVKPNGKWSDERVVIFTEYRATLNWLHEQLAMNGLTEGGRVMTLYGGMPSDQREAVKAAFQASPHISAVRILLATDAASEGIDLQNHCHRILHIEIPWNPNRLEQRNGRLDRHGQKKNVQVFHFVAKGYKDQRNTWDEPGEGLEADGLQGDLEFLFRAVKKVEAIREDLGKVGPVIAQQVEEAMLGRRRKLDTAQAERESEPVKRMLKFERDLRAQIARHMEQLQESRQAMNFSAENTRRIVATALELAGQRGLIPVTLTPDPSPKGRGESPLSPGLPPTGREESPLSPGSSPTGRGEWSIIPDPSPTRRGEFAYELPALSGSWAACLEGLAHPHTGQVRPIVFDHSLVDGRDDVVLAHLNHRLVQMSLRLLRAEVWSPTSRKGLHRITARVVPDTALSAPATIAFARLVVIGGDQNRLHEEIISAGGLLKSGKLERFNVTQARAALEAAAGAQIANKEVSQAMQGRLLALYPQIINSLESALEARRKDRLDGIHKLLVEREEFEANGIQAILTELAKSIEAELSESQSQQLDFLKELNLDERDQLNRNLDALRRRLQAIPAEIEREQLAIRKRYADPQARMFPVAVVFLVPERFG